MRQAFSFSVLHGQLRPPVARRFLKGKNLIAERGELNRTGFLFQKDSEIIGIADVQFRVQGECRIVADLQFPDALPDLFQADRIGKGRRTDSGPSERVRIKIGQRAIAECHGLSALRSEGECEFVAVPVSAAPDPAAFHAVDLNQRR